MENMTFEEVLQQVQIDSDRAISSKTKASTAISEEEKRVPLSQDLEWKTLSSLFQNSFEHIENKGIQSHFNYKRTYYKFHKIQPRKEHDLTETQLDAFNWLNHHGEVLEKNFTFKQLKAKYRDLAKILHPDMGGKSENFIKLEQCYKELKKCFL